MWTTTELTDKAEILSFLETDRLYAAYAIGDLEPALYRDCTWVVAVRAGRIEALTLHYRGLDPAAYLLIGDIEGLRTILARPGTPERVYLTCRPQALPYTRAFFAWDEVTPMWRMVLRPERFRPVRSVPDDAILAPLRPEDVAELNRLFDMGGGRAFLPSQIEKGIFYGILAEDTLVAVAGTHLISKSYGVAAIGNVFTDPSTRRRGYATLATAAVAGELLRRGIRDVVLNVAQENAGAVQLYETLGFERYCPFLEGPATKRATLYSEARRR